MSVGAVLIAGPTASGKSAVALALAERTGGTVINADSMQVYAELRVLTARPSAADEARALHRLYGHVSVRTRYSAAIYQDDAARTLAEARAAGRVAIFTGGTGLYFSALTAGLSPIPPVPANVREDMRRQLEEAGPDLFYAAFAARDPDTAGQLRPRDVQRVLRAAEVLEATGRPLRAWQQNKGVPVLEGLRTARFVLAPPREVLKDRIDARFQAMTDSGGLDEARLLAGLDPALPAARALGVPSLLRHLAGEMSLDEAIAEGQAETRRYAKRQMTWFRRYMKDWKWLEMEEIGNIISNTMPEIA